MNINFKEQTHTQQILSYGIFYFHIPRMLPFGEFSDLQLPFLGQENTAYFAQQIEQAQHHKLI